MTLKGNQAEAIAANETDSNITSPQKSAEHSRRSGNVVTTIAAAARMRHLDSNLLTSVATYFDMSISRATANSVTELTTGILSAAAKLDKSEYMDAELTIDTICCFNNAGNMLCTLLSLDETIHNVALPEFMNTTAVHLSRADKVKLLTQAPLFMDQDNHGTAELEWTDLTLPQMHSILEHSEVSFGNTEGPRDLKHRLFNQRSFSKTHGTDSKVALFYFHSTDPLNCTSIGSIPKADYAQRKKLTNNPVLAPTPVLTHTSSTGLNPQSESTQRIEPGDTITTSSPIHQADHGSSNSDSEEHNGYCKDSSRSPTLTADRFKFTIIPRSALGVIDDYCTSCGKNTTGSTLTCYLCKLTVHHPCYKGKTAEGKRKKNGMPKTSFDILEKIPNCRWFCNGCSKISIEDILDKITEYTQAKVDEAEEEKLKNVPLQEVDTSKTLDDSLNRSSTSSMDSDLQSSTKQVMQSLDDLKNSITKELRAALREDMVSLVAEIKQSNNTQPCLHHDPQNSNPEKATFAAIVSRSSNKSTPPKQIPHNTLSMKEHEHKTQLDGFAKSDYLVDPKLSIIIKQVSNKKIITNDTSLKSEFNKLFNRMKIKYCKKTRYGNIILQLNSEEDIEQVLTNWEPNFFKDPSAKVGTQVFRMTDKQVRKHVGIIRHVPPEIETESISEAFTEAKLKDTRVTRLGRMSHSVKVVFKSHEDLNRAIKDGLGLDHLWLAISEFKFYKKPMQCHSCKRFGHPVKWCRSKPTCGFCASENHTDKDCDVKADVSRHICRNCRGNHSSLSTQCPQFQEKLRFLQNTNNDDGQ
jgi:hypothetical protein